MTKPHHKWVDIYFYSHPIDQSIRYVGSEKFGKEPAWLVNNQTFNEWIGEYRVDINILDTVESDKVEFWTAFYKDLFSQWGFSLIEDDSSARINAKKVLDVHKLKNVLVNTLYDVHTLDTPIRLKDFGDFFYGLDKLNNDYKDQFLSEVTLLIYCLFVNGIPLKNCLLLSSSQINKGYQTVGGTIVAYSDRLVEYSKFNCQGSDTKIFKEVLKVCSKSSIELFLKRYINTLSVYFGYSWITEGEFLKDFGRLQYWKSGTSFSTSLFLIRLFRCKSRLELLMKLNLIPYLR